MTIAIEDGDPPMSIDDAKRWLRLGTEHEDAVVTRLIRAAAGLCEAFTGQMLMVRSVSEEMPVAGDWKRLAQRPVVAIDAVEGLAADEPDFALAADGWSHAIDRDGAARLRIERPGIAGRVRVSYRAGLASDAGSIPEAIRQGLVRMAQHLYAARDGDDAEPPAIIAALWQPWRRMSLGAAARLAQ